MQYKTYAEYESALQRLNPNTVKLENHHVIPLQAFWEDQRYNIAKCLQRDHVDVHQKNDIPYRYRGPAIRKQRQRENGHIVLTTDDINGRADIQRRYLEWVKNLPVHLIDMHEVKLSETLEAWNGKLQRLIWETLEIDETNYLEKFESWIRIQKEISIEIYKIIKGKRT